MSRSLERPKIVDISQWLETLGLRRYADAFADNDIDFELLQDLTADDLKELGVNSLGHRKKILTAAGLLQQRDAGTPLADKPAKIRSEGPKSEQKEVSERRQVTVLFADLVAYTSLTQSLGDEDIHLFLSRYFEIVDTIIRRHGGTVDKHIGDCVMAIYGAPLARSNDAERAVRAAIEITQLLVRPLGDEFLFSHALIRDGIYDSILSARRRPLHGRAAAWFDGGDLALKAEHLERAEDLQAANAYLSAANQQAGLYRFDRALALVNRGQTLSSEPAVLFELTRLEGDLLRELGSTSASIDACGRALNCAHTEPQICRAKIGLVAAIRVADRLDEALTLLDEAESVARANSLDAELSEIHYYRGSLFFPQGNLEGCLEQHELALDSATRAQLPERQTLALSGLGDAYYAQGRMRTAHQVFRRCLDLCHTHGFGRVEAANLFMLGTVRIYLNELDDALDDALRSAEVASRVGHKRAEIVSRLTAGWVLISMAKVDAAREQVERGLDLADTIGAQRFTPFLSESLARIVLLKGSHAEAVRILEAALATARDLDLMTFIGPWVLGTLAETTAQPTRRQETLQEGHLLLSQGCVGHNYYRFYQSAVETSLHAGSWDDADRYAAALADYTKHEPVPWSDFYIERGFALAEHGRGARSEKLRTTLKRLRDRAVQVGLRMALPALDVALQQPWPRSIHTRVE